MKLLALSALLVLVGSVATGALAAIGIDLAKPYPTDVFVCLQATAKVAFVISDAFNNGQPTYNAPINCNAAKLAGINYCDISMRPCPSINAQQQVNTMLNEVGQGLTEVGTAWVKVQTGHGACAWQASNATANCDFLTAIVNALIQRGSPVGIYSSRTEWTALFGAANACASVATLVPKNVWVANWDGKPSWDGEAAFGGWSAFAMKQFQNGPSSAMAACGVSGSDASQDWYPN